MFVDVYAMSVINSISYRVSYILSISEEDSDDEIQCVYV